MPEFNEIVKLAIDCHRGVQSTYSTEDAMETLRKALIEANNGETFINFRSIRDGKCNGLFAIIETIIANEALTGVIDTDFFNTLVDYRNLAQGDSAEFVLEDGNLYAVAETADGTQAVRRQRIIGSNVVTVATTMKTVRIYEELNRLLAKRSDMNKFIDTVSKSFARKIMDDIYTLFANATAADLGGAEYFPVAGTYSTDDLLDVIAHVEAAAGGKPATIVGTKKACRMLAPAIVSDKAKDDIYNDGYMGKFYGTPVIAIPQRHKVGSKQFQFDDKMLTIIAGDQRPIKFVYEGDALVIPGDATKNADLTQEYFIGEKYGLALAMAANNSGLGRYSIL